MRILVVEDTRDMNRLIVKALTKAGYSVDGCYDREEALDYLAGAEYDAMVLDVMMPKLDGHQLLAKLRAEGSDLPVLFLTARDSIADRVEGLDLGADDYLVKPFGMLEMVSRVRAVLRRCQAVSAPAQAVSGLVLNPEAHTVTVDGQRVSLTFKEFALLQLFLEHPGVAFTREQLLSQVWDTDFLGETRTVDMHIRTLRQKLGRYGSRIETVRNVGYRLETQNDS